MVRVDYKNFRFEGVSEGGIQTTVTCHPLDLAFDIGRCPLQTVAIPQILLTHGHLDHAAGIPYYVSQRALRNAPAPKVYMPPELKPHLDKIMDVYADIEDFRAPHEFIPAEFGQKYQLKGNYHFTPYKSTHRVPSQGYTIYETTKKLKREYRFTSQQEIVDLKRKGVEVSEVKEIPLISFSGDTQIEYILDHEEVRKSKVLFIECTYVDGARTVEQTRHWGHTHLDEIVANADAFENEFVYLIHFSTRYKKNYINKMLDEKLPDILKSKVIPFVQ